MKTKIIEIRDEGTFFSVVCVDMNPDNDAQRYYLRRCGYPCDGRPNILISRVNGDGRPSTNDPYHWGDRTLAAAHNWIIQNWDSLSDGSVADVEFILGEKPAPKVSERLARIGQ